MSSSRDPPKYRARGHVTYTKIEHPARAPLFTITMLRVEIMHEDLYHEVTMPILPIMLCCVCLHIPMPYVVLQLPSLKHHASELHTQTRQTCTQAYTTTKELSSPMSSLAKTIDEKMVECMPLW